jgi:ribonucleotide monophosphatase NagD (HAD superfamily)
MPGAGALVAAVQAATNVTPLVIGKPGPYLFNEALRRLGSSEEDTAMVGDRLTTDIAGAQAVGLPAILLLSGVTDQIGAAVSGVKPEWTFADLAALTAAINTPATSIATIRGG